MNHFLHHLTRPHHITVGQVTFRVATGGLTLPALLFLAVNDLPHTVTLPVLGQHSSGEAALLALGILIAIYVHEAGHVAAARWVDMPLEVVALDKAFPSVVPHPTDQRCSDPRRRFWFAAGGAITDLSCAAVCTIAALLAQPPTQALLAGYVIGALINSLNVLPLTLSGVALVVLGAAGTVTTGSSRWTTTLVVLGMVVAVAGSLTTRWHSDGDLALAAWKEWRHTDEDPRTPSPPP